MHRHGRVALFVLAEVLLVMAIPFLVIEGYHTLLDSRAGTFVAEPGRGDPGWSALVEPSAVVAVAEVDRGRLTGIALVVVNPGRPATGGVFLLPAGVQIGGAPLGDRPPAEAVQAVGEELRLGFARVDVLDGEGWAEVLGGSRYQIDNPDPVYAEPAGAGQAPDVLVPVGSVSLDASVVPAFLGWAGGDGSPLSMMPRRSLWWEALMASPPETPSPLSQDLQTLAGAGPQVIDLPVSLDAQSPTLDVDGAERLIHEVVGYPTGWQPGDRLRLRILDRTGSAPLELLAADLAGQGVEVVEIGNATVFDAGPTEVIVPSELAEGAAVGGGHISWLAAWAGRQEVLTDTAAPDPTVVTLVVGSDFDHGQGP
jgi:hypothetical protein